MIAARLAVWTCVVASLLALHAAPALALSGYASDQAAVNAQYPDAGARGSGLLGAGPATSLGSLTTVRQAVEGNSPRARRARATERDIEHAAVRAVQKAVGAVPAAVVLGPTQSGSIALLIGGVGVLSVGGALRWRRRGMQF